MPAGGVAHAGKGAGLEFGERLVRAEAAHRGHGGGEVFRVAIVRPRCAEDPGRAGLAFTLAEDAALFRLKAEPGDGLERTLCTFVGTEFWGP